MNLTQDFFLEKSEEISKDCSSKKPYTNLKKKMN